MGQRPPVGSPVPLRLSDAPAPATTIGQMRIRTPLFGLILEAIEPKAARLRF